MTEVAAMLFMAGNSVCNLKPKEIITVMTKSLNGAIEAQKLMDPEILFKLLERIKFEIPTSTEPWSKWKKKVKRSSKFGKLLYFRFMVILGMIVAS